MQGSAAIRDMAESNQVSEIVAADLDIRRIQTIITNLETSKSRLSKSTQQTMKT